MPLKEITDEEVAELLEKDLSQDKARQEFEKMKLRLRYAELTGKGFEPVKRTSSKKKEG